MNEDGFNWRAWLFSTYFDCAPTPFRCPFASAETYPVSLAPRPFSNADDWVELAGDPEVEVESWGWEGEGWVDPVLWW